MTEKDRAERILRALESIAKSLKMIAKEIKGEDAQEDGSGSGRMVGFQAPGKNESENIHDRK